MHYNVLYSVLHRALLYFTVLYSTATVIYYSMLEELQCNRMQINKQ